MDDEAEDLSKIEWGAGLSKVIDGQLANIIFFSLGWSLLALPCYLGVGSDEHYLSEGNDIVFPIVLSIVLLVVCAAATMRLRAPLIAARLHAAAMLRGGLQAPLVSPVASPGRAGPALTSLPSHTDEVDTSWSGILGFAVHSSGMQRKVEKAALVFATLGWVGAGWASGLSTFCAYNKGHDVVFWEECYKVSWAFTGESSQPFGNGLPTKLPVKYFTLLLLAVLCALVGPVLWFVLWKVIRQIVRPARAQHRRANGLRELPQTAMFGLAFSVGIISGSGAWVFRQMIGLVHNALFMQKDLVTSNATHYNANVHTPPPHGLPQWLIVFAPIVGGLIVAFLVQNWAPEAKGHGVPEVMDAIHYKEGKIRPSVAGVKILASSFSIGSGGSVGREGPIIQIGSTFGSMVGVASGCSVSQRVTLIACGAAGGIAATFNTPIGGVVFAMELMLPASNSRTLMPLGIASVVATYIGRAALGLNPAFYVPALEAPEASVESVIYLLYFVPFGILVGLVSVMFVKGIYWSEDFFEAMPGNYYSRHSIGMLGQGLLIYLMITFSGPSLDPISGQFVEHGHYYVQGVGYATIVDVLGWQAATEGNHTGHWQDRHEAGISNPPFCLLLFFAKFLSTNLTIGSGASGGIFSPSLFIGATLGGVWGHVVAAVGSLEHSTGFNPIQACVAGVQIHFFSENYSSLIRNKSRA